MSYGEAEVSTVTSDTNDAVEKPEIGLGDNQVDLDKFKVASPEDDASALFAGMTVDEPRREFFFKKFSGTKTIAKLKKDDTIYYKSQIKSGKLNVLILDSDYKVLRVLDVNQEETITLDFEDTNEIIIRAIGEEASDGNVIIEVK